VPECGKPLTLGVLYRISELADRTSGEKPATAGTFQHILALPEIMGEILGVGPKSKKVTQPSTSWSTRSARNWGSCWNCRSIRSAPPATRCSPRRSSGCARAGAQGSRLRRRIRHHLDLRPGELSAGDGLFSLDLPAPRAPKKKQQKAAAPVDEPTMFDPEPEPVDGLLGGLDPDQRAAAAVVAGPLLIVAGPGTGKTRTLTHRIAHLITAHHLAPQHCLAITFTRRACEEMRERLAALVPAQAQRITVATFHGLGLDLLREQRDWRACPRTSVSRTRARSSRFIRDLLDTTSLRDARKALEERSPRTVAPGPRTTSPNDTRRPCTATVSSTSTT